jgi:hypothetical protein
MLAHAWLEASAMLRLRKSQSSRDHQNGVHPPSRNRRGTTGSGLPSLKCPLRYANAPSRSESDTRSLCESFSASHRAAVRCPMAEQARLWQDPQLFSTASRPGPGGNRSAVVAGIPVFTSAAWLPDDEGIDAARFEASGVSLRAGVPPQAAMAQVRAINIQTAEPRGPITNLASLLHSTWQSGGGDTRRRIRSFMENTGTRMWRSAHSDENPCSASVNSASPTSSS